MKLVTSVPRRTWTPSSAAFTENALGVALPEAEKVVVAGGKVADVQPDLRVAHAGAALASVIEHDCVS